MDSYSNMYVRIFGGCTAGDTCTRTHLRIAQQRLEDFFSVILVADTLDSFYLSAYLLATRLGWNDTDVSKSRSGTMENSNARTELANHPEAFGKLVLANELDLEFYAFAKTLTRKQIMADTIQAERNVVAGRLYNLFRDW